VAFCPAVTVECSRSLHVSFSGSTRLDKGICHSLRRPPTPGPGHCRQAANMMMRRRAADGPGLFFVTAWAEPDGLTRAEPLELCDESVARTVPSQYNPERRETSNKEIQPFLRHVHGCISSSRSIPGVSSASVRINKCYVF
jgi:hypothetical protein